MSLISCIITNRDVLQNLISKEIVVSDKKVHYCYFCPGDQSSTQIQRHLRDSHANEIEVLKASNEKYKKDEILRISMLRQKGNHLHNLEVVRQKRGYLVVAKNNNHSWNEFLPCAFCKSWILKNLSTKHRQKCNLASV